MSDESSRGRVIHLGHLVRRFAGSLSSRPPLESDLEWVQQVLRPNELTLWLRHNNIDRRHTIQVARRAVELRPSIAGPTERAVLVAALLHDIGKLDANLGTVGRVLATVWGSIAGDRAQRGSGRISRYLRHEPLGAELARSGGCEPLAVALIARSGDVPSDLLAVLDGADEV